VNHNETVSGLVDGGSYDYYVRCLDGSGNNNSVDYLVSFSVSVGVVCGDGLCEPGENCPQDNVSCTDNGCYEPTCVAGCGETFVVNGGNDESCLVPSSCDGFGSCVAPVCSLTTASWDVASAVEGDTLILNVTGSSCGGELINFTVWEDDVLFDNLAAVQPVDDTFVGTLAQSNWVAEDGDIVGDSEFYFIAEVEGDSITSGLVSVSDFVDIFPPGISNGAPTGTLPFGTTDTIFSIETDEVATCKYSTSAGIPYGTMIETFDGTNGVSHSELVSGLVNGGSYNNYNYLHHSNH